MPVFHLNSDEPVFPKPSLARNDGLLAFGGRISPEWLKLAYANGIFPWYNPGEEILWWSPDPRFVLFPDKLKVSKSMRPYFNQRKYDVSFDQRFKQVMENCRDSNRGGEEVGSWISDEMIEGYVALHQAGIAHSVEVWKEGALVGGLYGVALGKVFFGESMFTELPNASKFGFISLVKSLEQAGFKLIDCQQETRHLGSLGAELIPRSAFLDILESNSNQPGLTGNWGELFSSK